MSSEIPSPGWIAFIKSQYWFSLVAWNNSSVNESPWEAAILHWCTSIPIWSRGPFYYADESSFFSSLYSITGVLRPEVCQIVRLSVFFFLFFCFFFYMKFIKVDINFRNSFQKFWGEKILFKIHYTMQSDGLE